MNFLKLLCLGSLSALLLSCGPANQAPQVTQAEPRWVSTWGTANQLLVESLPPWVQPPPADSVPAEPAPPPAAPALPQTFADQSVRMVVRSSVGGSQLRLLFANAQGLPAMTLGEVRVALHRGSGAIDAASDRVVTFGGKGSATLHPGALLVSDPVNLTVPALTELAVSVYLPEPADTRAFHEIGLNTTYISSGNTVAAVSVAADNTNLSYFWLTGMEVLAPAISGTIIAFGDSITDGYSATPDTHRAWPSLLAERLQQNPATAHLGVINMGISGNRVLRNGIGTSALGRFDRDVLARAGVEWLILLEGINDINFTALPGIPASEQTTAAGIIEGLSQLVDRAHARGIKVMGATLTPMGGLWLHNDMTEAMRQEVNLWIRNSGKYDALVDFDAILRNPADPTRLRPEHDIGDFIHPNDAGNAAIAEAIELQVFAR
jgi:lysophospholipase L1-like esterase